MSHVPSSMGHGLERRRTLYKLQLEKPRYQDVDDMIVVTLIMKWIKIIKMINVSRF
jgi:hypothetical protein